MGSNEKIVSALACLVLLASCAGENPDTDAGSGAVTTSELQTLTATAPNLPTKLNTRDGAGLLWENKDAITLRCQPDLQTVPSSCVYSTSLAAPKATASFKKDAGQKSDPDKTGGKYIAVYPASPAYLEWGKDGYVVLATRSEQTARSKYLDKSSSILIASSEDSEFHFRHVVSYIKISVTSTTSPFSKITVRSADSSQPMVSRIRVNFDSDFSYSLDPVNASDFVSLASANGSDLPEGTYLIAVNPDNYTKGFKITFENSSGGVTSKDYSGSYDVAPGGVIDLGAVGSLGFEVSLPHIALYRKGNTDLGVVFFQDPANPVKKKVLSAAGVLSKWATSNDKWRIIPYKEDYDYVHTVVTTSEKYQDNPNDFPAVKFCEQMRRNYGGNWHLPSLTEMEQLFNGYYGKAFDTDIQKYQEYTDSKSKSSARYFDSLLESAGGAGLLNTVNDYWICAQNTSGNVQYVNLKRYLNGNDVQTSEKYVRCVLDVDETVPDGSVVYPSTDIGRLIKGPLASRIVDILWDTTYTVTSGLSYYWMRVKTDDPTDNTMDAYLLRADLSKGLDIKVAVSDLTTPEYMDSKVLTELASLMSTQSKPVFAMVNGDFRDIPKKRPRGPLHASGRVYWSDFSLDEELYPEHGLSYIAMTNGGKLVIGPRDEYYSVMSSLPECTGAGRILVDDSKIVAGGAARDPRTAIGYTSGDIVWMLTVDGRHKGTEGMTYSEMACIFFALDCERAVNMDGGGSAEMIVRNPRTGIIEVCNWPSDSTEGNNDGGKERPRPSAWAIVKK